MKILFMCVANSARSQLAEGLARRTFGSFAQIESAGSQPSKLNPFAVKSLQEIGIDISKHYSKSVEQLSPDFMSNLDYVVTLCAEEVCPILISKAERLHWPFGDPAGRGDDDLERLQHFREARDAIKDKIEEFAREII